MIRGIKQQVALFEMFMQTQMFPWKRKNLKTGKDEIILVQGALRVMPFGYEYVFPEECLDEVLTMLQAKSTDGRYNLGKFRNMILRVCMGKGDAGDRVKPIPEYTPVPTNRYIEMNGVALYFIGIKKDSRNILRDYEQEML
jgi:hypothetical protein